jgi:predicted regulator of Ras-like GTPase activity (Roadblock/LC7/MglB family)
MDASAALERLRDISSQVRSAVVFDRNGKVLASTLGDDERAAEVAREAQELLSAAEARSSGGSDFAQLEVALQSGSVFVVRDAERLIAATTPPDPTVGLVFYDLKSCLRELDEPAKARRKPVAKPKADAKPKPKPRAKKDDAKP